MYIVTQGSYTTCRTQTRLLARLTTTQTIESRQIPLPCLRTFNYDTDHRDQIVSLTMSQHVELQHRPQKADIVSLNMSAHIQLRHRPQKADSFPYHVLARSTTAQTIESRQFPLPCLRTFNYEHRPQKTDSFPYHVLINTFNYYTDHRKQSFPYHVFAHSTTTQTTESRQFPLRSPLVTQCLKKLSVVKVHTLQKYILIIYIYIYLYSHTM